MITKYKTILIMSAYLGFFPGIAYSQDLSLVCKGDEKTNFSKLRNGSEEITHKTTTRTYVFEHGKSNQYKFCSWNTKRIYCSNCDPSLDKISGDICREKNLEHLYIDRISGVSNQLQISSDIKYYTWTMIEFEGNCQISKEKKF